MHAIMEEEKETSLFEKEEISSDDASSEGIPEYDFTVAQHATKRSESVSFEKNKIATTSEVYVADGSQSVAKKERNNRKWKQKCANLCEILLLTTVLLVIIGLFCIPTVLYALPSEIAVAVRNESEIICTEVQVYSGEICTDVFTSLQMCFSGVTSPPPALNIPSLIDQQTAENDAMTLVNGLNFLRPSQECREAIMPFLCLFSFKLCDSSSQLHTILRDDCLFLRDDICVNEWRQAVGILGAGVLPVCEDLPDISDECIVNATMSVSPDLLNVSNLSNGTTGQKVPSPVCAKGFFYDENGTQLCRPICGEFIRSPVVLIILERITISLCFIASLIMFVLVLILQRDSLLVFPSILFVYICITTFVASTVTIVGFFDNTRLFCSSRDFVNATEQGNETPFCTVSGFFFNYCVEQICVWAVLHAVFLFWGVKFPFSYRQLRVQKRIRYAHIISVILAVVVPLPGALIHLKDGHISATFPTNACGGRNLDFTYYTFILPISVMIGTTSCLLVLILWTIFKEFVLKKLLARKKVGRVGKAQIKIMAVIIYYTILGVMGLVAYTAFEVAADSYRETIVQYVLCESTGLSECELTNDTTASLILSKLVMIMVSLLPVVAILFNCDPKAWKKFRDGKKFKAARSYQRSDAATSKLK